METKSRRPLAKVLLISIALMLVCTACRGRLAASRQAYVPGPSMSDIEFEEQVLNAQVPVMVEFWQNGCVYCVRYAPTVETFAERHGNRIPVISIDTQVNARLASRYAVRGTPTTIFFKEGKVARTVVGAVPISSLEQISRELLQ